MSVLFRGSLEMNPSPEQTKRDLFVLRSDSFPMNLEKRHSFLNWAVCSLNHAYTTTTMTFVNDFTLNVNDYEEIQLSCGEIIANKV